MYLRNITCSWKSHFLLSKRGMFQLSILYMQIDQSDPHKSLLNMRYNFLRCFLLSKLRMFHLGKLCRLRFLYLQL